MKEKADKKDRTILSLSITVEDKKILKRMALERDMTVAALIHEWIEERFEEGNK